MQILENHNLKDFTSMQIGGDAKFFGIIENEDDLEELFQFSKEKSLPLIIIGRGTNTIFKDGNIDAVVGIMDIKGIRKITDFPKSAQIECKAGEEWDDLCAWAVENELAGIEALSKIPGTTGAAPVQNIGAYGSELSDTFVNVRAFDTLEEEHVLLGWSDCEFSYRDSIFKKEPGRYIITSLTVELSKEKPEPPHYKDVQLYFLGRKTKPGLKQIRTAITKIRSEKLPDPKKVPNAGSFFKNPILKNDHAAVILRKYPEAPHFKTDDEHIKLYAGWLIEKAGFKGKEFGNVSLYPKNALVVTTNGEASFKELEQVRKKIVAKIREMFDIDLEMEPQILG